MVEISTANYSVYRSAVSLCFQYLLDSVRPRPDCMKNPMDPQTGISDSAVMKRRHSIVAGKLLFLAIGMFGFGYLMVPIYDIICEVTGLNGKTGRVAITQSMESLDPNREITVEFVGIVNAGGSWEFKPNVTRMQVKPGELYQTSFYAKNLSSSAVVGQASPSVSPAVAARFFNKTECFCFTRQEFDANSGRDMPITFVVDPDLPANVDLITLSYTFFRSREISS